MTSLLCDVWGVVHNGLERVSGRLRRADARRGRGGAVVVFITNAPRPQRGGRRASSSSLHVPREAYDAHRVVRRRHPRRDHIAAPARASAIIGPERDHSIFAGLDVKFAPLERADYVVCYRPRRR